MATEIKSQVMQLYSAYFNRVADKAGVDYWVNEMNTKGWKLSDVAQSFSHQQEYKCNYANKTNTQIVTDVYKNVLNRQPDAPGLTYWKDELDRGVYSVDYLIMAVIAAAKEDKHGYGDNAVLINKNIVNEHAYINNNINTSISLAPITKNSSTIESVKNLIKSYSTQDSQKLELLQKSLKEIATIKGYSNSSISQTATANSEYINTLDSLKRWNKDSLTYSFNKSIPTEYITNPQTSSDVTTRWRELTTHEKNMTREIFSTISKSLGIKITEVQSGGDLQFNTIDKGANSTIASAFYPGNSMISGDVFLNSFYFNREPEFSKGSHLYSSIVHEIGHALGLKHPFEGSSILPSILDNTNYTIMSYKNVNNNILEVEWNASTKIYGVKTADLASRSDFALLDIHALQSIYGANNSYNLGNNRYTIDDFEHLVIWDAGGVDTIDLSNKIGSSYIDMRDGTLSSANILTRDFYIQKAMSDLRDLGAPVDSNPSRIINFIDNFIDGYEDRLYFGENNLAIAKGTIIENLKTGSGDDIVWDNGVNNIIHTGAGDDIIHLGRGGFDYVDGGSGYDEVHFNLYYRDVDIKSAEDCSIVVVGNNFAAQLLNIDKLIFNDISYLI